MFKNIITKFLKNKDQIKKELLDRVKLHNIDINLTQKIASLNKKITELEAKKEKLLELVTNNYIANQEFSKKNEAINIEINNIKKELKDIESDKKYNGNTEKKLENIKEELEKQLSINNNFVSFMDLLIDKIYVSKINNNRNLIKLDILLKTGITKSLNYDNKQPMQNQLIELKNDGVSFFIK